MRRAWGAVLAAVLVGAAGCGDDAEVGLSPPGTALAGGLEVPVGTRLVGPVFLRPPGDSAVDQGPPQRSDSVAVMRVDGDPFAAWDDLAGQARALGLQMAASGVCGWHRARPLAEVPSAPTSGPVAEARPELADTLDCQAVAGGPLPDGTQVMVGMRLWWWDAGAELHVDISEGGVPEPSYAYPGTDPGPAPATAVDQLPEREPQPPVDVGDPFGSENNCFESGYDRLALPDGARLVGGGTTPGLHVDFAAVLDVDDAEAVLGQLRDQMDDPDESDGDYGLRKESLAGGRTIWALGGGVSAGGGACSMWSSPDGTAVIVTTSSD